MLAFCAVFFFSTASAPIEQEKNKNFQKSERSFVQSLMYVPYTFFNYAFAQPSYVHQNVNIRTHTPEKTREGVQQKQSAFAYVALPFVYAYNLRQHHRVVPLTNSIYGLFFPLDAARKEGEIKIQKAEAESTQAKQDCHKKLDVCSDKFGLFKEKLESYKRSYQHCRFMFSKMRVRFEDGIEELNDEATKLNDDITSLDKKIQKESGTVTDIDNKVNELQKQTENGGLDLKVRAIEQKIIVFENTLNNTNQNAKQRLLELTQPSLEVEKNKDIQLEKQENASKNNIFENATNYKSINKNDFSNLKI
jgi:hypothetical protein